MSFRVLDLQINSLLSKVTQSYHPADVTLKETTTQSTRDPVLITAITALRFLTKVGQVRLKWYKSGTFSDHISVHFGLVSQNVLKLYLDLSHLGI